MKHTHRRPPSEPSRRQGPRRRSPTLPTSAAVWDVPSPVAIRSRFRVKVGISCSASCRLTGRLVDVRDETGTTIGEGRLGEQPWPGTRALYWAELELTAPATDGLTVWVLTFPAAGMAAAHADASMPFSFKTDRPPAHRVTITVTAAETGAPIAGADVGVGVYRTATDADGLTRCEVPAGAYPLTVWSDGYGAPPTTVDVTRDVTVAVTAVKTLTAAEQEADLERYEASQWG